VSGETQKLRRWLWRRLLWLAAGLVLLAAAAVILAPMFLPESVVRRQVESTLAERMGLPVTIQSAAFTWTDGLHLTGLRISRSAKTPDALLAKADRLAVRMSPWELLQNWGGDVPLEVVRAEGLEVWVIIAADGRLNLDDLPPTEAKIVQVVGGTFHIENQALGRSVTLSNVNASIGKLAASGKSYINLAADLPGSKPRGLLVTASLNSLDFSKRDRLAGNVKIEWSGAPWAEVAGVITADPNVRDIAGRTSGRLGASFERGGWSVEGAIEATDLVVARAPNGPAAIVPQAVLGLQVRQLGPGKPIEVSLAKFSAPGIDVRASGTVDLPTPAQAPQAAATQAQATKTPALTMGTPVAAQESPAAPAAGSKTTKAAGEKTSTAAAAAAAPPAPAIRPRGLNLEATVTLTWAPLCQNIAALKRVAEQFKELGGGADATIRLVTKPEGFQVTGSADLSHTAVAWPEVLHKDAGQALRLEIDATCSRDLDKVDLTSLALFAEAGRSDAGRPLPLVTAKGRLGKPAETHLDITAAVGQTEMLLAFAPAVASALAPFSAQGPMDLHATLKPTETSDGPAALAATVHADLTATRLLLPDGAQKRPETRCTLDVSAAVVPEARQINIGSVRAGLAGGTLEWDGSARIEWPKDSPVGRFEGTLKVAAVESAGAVVAPGRFSAASSPVAGEATFDCTGELSEGSIRGRLKADLDRLAIRAEDWFVKPLGQAASVSATGFWKAGRGDHYILAEADIRVPGGTFHALGRGTLLVTWPKNPAAAEGKPDALRQGFPEVRPASESTLELNASVSDMARLMELSPAAKQCLAGSRLEGAAEGSLVFSVRPRAGHMAVILDLTGAALDLGDALHKPRAMPMRLDVLLDILPPQAGAIELYLAKAEARLGDSVTGASGHVKMSRPAPDCNLTNGRQVLALLQEVDLEVHADWRHTPELRKALPWLEPLYSRADLDGLTRLSVSCSGTPLKGKVRAGVDATDCRILHGESILKPAGTAAAVDVEARYGESPGELVLDRFALKLADSAVSVAGRMFFDNPNLSALAPPTSWTFSIDGKAPDAAALAALFPARLGDLKPSGGMTFKVRASADPRGAELEACDLAFDKAAIVCLGKKMLLAGPISYDGERLATDGLNIVVGQSDITLVAYIQQPDRAPTGSIMVRGKNLDLKEILDLIQEASQQVAAWATAVPAVAPPAPPAAAARGQAQPASPPALSRQLALYAQRLLSDAQLSAELAMERVTITVPEWNTTYELSGLTGEGRLAGRQFSVPRFQCRMNEGAIRGDVLLDFRQQPPVLTFMYDARDLKMADNLKPFVESTFPGMQVFGTVSQRVNTTQVLAEGGFPKGRGETTLNDGLLRGPGAPDYITAVLPGLKLSEYPFRRMTDDFENKGNGEVENRMIFEGKSYDIYIFGTSHADGQVDYSLGVDLLVSLGSKILTRNLDQGKLPLMYYTGRIKGTAYAEGPFIRYVLPHEFAYDVFVRRNLLLQLVTKIGEKPPEIPKPPVVPGEKSRIKAEK
jgi:hypothetical protein